MPFALPAAIAATTATAAYLDAKFHLRKDLRDIYERSRLNSHVGSLIASDRLSLWYSFEAQARRLKDEPCIWYRVSPSSPVRIYTWTQTYEHACQWAQFLLSQGVEKGQLVATYLQNCPEFMFNMLACWAIGCAPALINFHLAGDGLVHCLKVADSSKVLIVDPDPECFARIEEVRERIEQDLGMKVLPLTPSTVSTIYSLPPTRPIDTYRDGVAPSFPLFIFYTSGTTGHPKACAFPTAAGHFLGSPRLRTSGLKSGPGGDTWYDCMPLYHGTGCTTAVGCAVSGVTLAIGRKFSVRNFWPDIHDSGAAAFVYVGETARYLLAAPPSSLDKGHKLKAMFGNGMRPDVWTKFITRFDIPTVNEFFNSTEGMLQLLNVARGPFHAAHVGHQGAIKRWQTHNLIVPVKIDHEGGGDNIYRDPATGFAVRSPYEEGGEVLIACATEKDFVGYWNNPLATAGRFEHDVFRKGDIYYRTGDALRRDADGRWFFLDRLGDTFRWKSENVSTAQVAEALGRFSGVVEANVYGVEVPGHDGRAGCAAIYINPEERPAFDWAALLAHARQSLPKYAVPVFVRVIGSQAPMHNNKQNKVPLRKEGVDLVKIVEGDAGKDDVIMWAKAGAGTYEVFTVDDWVALGLGKARL